MFVVYNINFFVGSDAGSMGSAETKLLVLILVVMLINFFVYEISRTQ